MPRQKKLPNIGTIDCETDPFEVGVIVEPFIWGIYLSDGTYRDFDTTESCAQFIADYDGILYAHNGGKFDYHFLRRFIESDDSISVIAGRVAKCKIGKCELRDSLNLFSGTRLADFSKMQFDYRKLRKRFRAKHMPEIKTYLRSDCENLFRLVWDFIETYGKQFTQAGAAMKLWRKKFAPRQEVPSSTAAFYHAFSPFYFGGRVQCFVSGNVRENFSVVDINSAYPRAMMDKHAYSTRPMTIAKLPTSEAAIPQSFIELDAVSKGALPLRAEDGSLYFPEDETRIRRYHCTGWEYLAGVETGTLKPAKIIACHLFGNPVEFTPYVHHFYNLRKEAKAAGNKAQDIFAKIFLNGLYGKFASNPSKYEEFLLSDPDSESYAQWCAAGYQDRGQWGGRSMMVRPLPEEKHRYYNIATGASITGWVRAFLWRSLLKVGNPLYCDTDSIAAGDVSRLSLGAELGQWKHEGDFDEYAIAGKKLYAFHKKGARRPLHTRRQMPITTTAARRREWEANSECWKLASKGSDLSPGEIIRAAKGETVTNFSQVPNYSIHRDATDFINRDVKNTFRDIRRMK